jgi:hypothetical protein
MPYVSRDDLLAYVYARDRRAAPQGLTIPAQLHAGICEVLGRLEVPVFSPRTPNLPPAASVFLLDDGDYILAEDFEVDLPEFVHDSSWFQPASGGAGHR